MILPLIVTAIGCIDSSKFKSFEDYPSFSTEWEEMIYTPENTNFMLWAPTADAVKVNIFDEGMGGEPVSSMEMKRGGNGQWTLAVNEDLRGKFYTFNVQIDGKWLGDTPGVMAKAVGVNGKRAAIINFDDTDPEGWADDKRPELKGFNDIILYEMHHRDFSVDSLSGIKNKGKFLALTEEGTKNIYGQTTGLDHLKELGITHVHILPSYDYASVDETKLDTPQYNWGYDPQNYNVPDGSYSTDPYKPEVRIREFKQMVQSLHKAGIRVIMDVVYNHTFNTDDSNFQLTVPGYFYRFNDDGTFANGSGCGNDIATERPMVHRYILDSVLYWAREYHIDGFRFDLMGLMDMALIQDIRIRLDEIYGKGEKLMYGEPWSAGMTAVAKGTQLADKSALMLMDENIGAFCDATRDLIKGSTFEVRSKGFSNGGRTDLSLFMKAFTGWSDGDWRFRVKAPSQTISYVSSHDDWTLWDKLVATMNENEMFLSLDENVMKANKLAASLYFTMQGHLFMLSGEEAARTKLGIRNSYASPIFINRFDWERAGQARELVEFYKGLIALRKALPCLTDKSASAKDRLIFFRPINDRTALLLLDDHDGPYDEIMLLYTQERDPFTIPVDGKWMILSDSQCSNRLDDPITADMKISSRGMEVMVLGRNRNGNGRTDS